MQFFILLTFTLHIIIRKCHCHNKSTFNILSLVRFLQWKPQDHIYSQVLIILVPAMNKKNTCVCWEIIFLLTIETLRSGCCKGERKERREGGNKEEINFTYYLFLCHKSSRRSKDFWLLGCSRYLNSEFKVASL